MGQLEKYGLYVLCLVIFLILGVTLWGDPVSASPGQQDKSVAIRANALGGDAAGGVASDGSTSNTSLPGSRPLVSGQLVNRPLVDSGGSGVPPGRDVSMGRGSGVSGLESLLRPGPRPPKSRPVGGGNRVTGDSVIAGTAGGSSSPGSKAGAEFLKPVPKPIVSKTRKYTVRKGDSLGVIAQRQLGSVRFVRQIRQLNPRLRGDLVRAGQVLVLPAKVADASGSGKSGRSGKFGLGRSGAYRTYTISKGDSFERIAWIELGSKKRAKDIMKLNPNVDPLGMPIGRKIKLPLK